MRTLLPAATPAAVPPPSMAALLSNKQADLEKDAEKDVQSISEDSQDGFYYTHPFMNRLKSWGVEARGMCGDLSLGVLIDSCHCRDSPCSARAASRYAV